MVMPLTLTLISEAFPVEKRGAAIGLWGGISGLAVAFGPVVGGAVVDGIDWHWIFWLNVPIGAVLIPLSARRLTESFGPRPKLDPVGLLLAGSGFLSATWGLVRANAVGWTSLEVIGNVLDPLILLDDKLQIHPLLATKWQIDDNAKRYTFTLRAVDHSTPANVATVQLTVVIVS